MVLQEFRNVGTTAERELGRVGPAAANANRALDGMGRSARSLGGIQAGNLAQQVQDVAVQAQSGTDALIIMAQQGPQIAGAFGPAGAVIGGIAAVALVAGTALYKLVTGHKDVAESAKQLDAAEKAIKETLAGTATSAEDLTGKYKLLGDQQERIERLEISSALRKSREAIQGQRVIVSEALRGIEGDLARLDSSSRVAASQGLRRPPEIQAAIDHLQELKKARDDFNKGGPALPLAESLDKLTAAVPGGAKPLGELGDKATAAAKATLELDAKIKSLEASLKVLQGNATEADRALIGEGGAKAAAKDADRYQEVLKGLETNILKVQDARRGFVQEQIDKLPQGATGEQIDEVERLAGAYYDANVAAKEAHKDQIGGAREAAGEEERYAGVLQGLQNQLLGLSDARQAFVDAKVSALGDQATGEQIDEVRRLAAAYYDANLAANAAHKDEIEGARQAAQEEARYADVVQGLQNRILTARNPREGFIREQVDAVGQNATGEQIDEVTRLAGAYYDTNIAAREAHKEQVSGARGATAAQREAAAAQREYAQALAANADVIDGLDARLAKLRRGDDPAEAIRAAGQAAADQIKLPSLLDAGTLPGGAEGLKAALGEQEIARAKGESIERQRQLNDANKAAISILDQLGPSQDKLVEQFQRLGPLAAGTAEDQALYNRSLAAMRESLGLGVEPTQALAQATAYYDELVRKNIISLQERDRLLAQAKTGLEEKSRQEQIASAYASGDPLKGAEAGGLELLDQYGNAAKLTSGLVSDVFQQGTDALTQMLMGAQVDSKALFRSIAAEVVSLTIKFLVLRTAAAIFGVTPSADGNVFQAGAVTPSADGNVFQGPGGAAIGSADGNALAGGNVIRFAKGGAFVDRPTTVPLALMGEAGPEAVVPLDPGPGGRPGLPIVGRDGSRVVVPLGRDDRGRLVGKAYAHGGVFEDGLETYPATGFADRSRSAEDRATQVVHFAPTYHINANGLPPEQARALVEAASAKALGDFRRGARNDPAGRRGFAS